MCIIVVKPKGIAMPKKAILKTCFKNNPDGAGIMLANKKNVWGFKGFMSFASLEKKLKYLEGRFGSLTNLPVVLHFRIGTSGSNIPGNTHPFPITDAYDQMSKLEWKADVGMAHNGIIYGLSRHDDVTKYNVSDTMIFVSKVAYHLNKHGLITADEAMLDIAEAVAESKLAFLDKNGLIRTRGNFEQKDGCLYSNRTFSDTYEKKTKKYDWNYYTPYSSLSKYSYNYDYEMEEGELAEMIRENEMENCAYDLGLTIVSAPTDVWTEKQQFVQLIEDNAVNLDGEIYEWSDDDYNWLKTGDIIAKQEVRK